MQPNTDLAVELLGKVKSLSTGDPTYRYQIAAVVLFLSGVDKALSVACQLLYIGGHVGWSWLKPRYPEPGVLGCGPGLTQKIKKLADLGLDLSRFDWLVQLRNQYVHEVSISLRYRAGQWDECGPMVVIKPCGPEVQFTLPPVVALGRDDLVHWTSELVDTVGAFVDKKGWHSRWRALACKGKGLPVDRSSATSTVPLEELATVIDSLTEKHIGIGFCRLLTEAADASRTEGHEHG